MLTVHSQALGAPIGQDLFWNTAGYVDVPVAPTLIEGDVITAAVKKCGGEIITTNSVTVAPVPAIIPPSIPNKPPLQEGMTFVPVQDVIAGAWVEVVVNGSFRGTRSLGASAGNVPITGELAFSDGVSVRQRLCGRTSEFSQPPVSVIHRLPIARFDAVPNAGTAPLDVSFVKNSLHANDPTEPFLCFFEDIGDGSGPTSTVANPDHTYVDEKEFTATLIARNASGHNNFISKIISVGPDSPDPDPTMPDEPDEASFVVWLTLAGTPQGPTPFEDFIMPRHNERLVRFENPGSFFEFRFIKPGFSTNDCSDSDAVVILTPGAALSEQQIEEIYATPKPGLDNGLHIAGCLAHAGSPVENASIIVVTEPVS